MKRLTKSAQQRVLANIDVAQKAAARAYSTQDKATYDELMGSAYYALCTIALGPYRGERFRKVATIACRWQIIEDQLRLHRDHIGRYPLVRTTVDEATDVPDVLSRLIATEDLIWVMSALPNLDRRPRQVLYRMLAGATVTEIAVELKIGHSAVSIHKRRGVSRLKEKLRV